MKITESKIRQIIREEARRVLREGAFPEEVEAVYGKPTPSGSGRPRVELEDYLSTVGGKSLVAAVNGAIDSALEKDEKPSSEDVIHRLSDEHFNMLPESDADAIHELLDAVLDDEWDPSVSDYARDIEDTNRELGHWSHFVSPRGGHR
jgi:hypothetical protein